MLVFVRLYLTHTLSGQHRRFVSEVEQLTKKYSSRSAAAEAAPAGTQAAAAGGVAGAAVGEKGKPE